VWNQTDILKKSSGEIPDGGFTPAAATPQKYEKINSGTAPTALFSAGAVWRTGTILPSSNRLFVIHGLV